MKVRVERDLCIGIGNCVAINLKVFKLDSSNKAVVINPVSISEDLIMKAAKSCPLNAIIIEDEDGQQLYP
jgi:ferredoxin